MTQLMFLTCEVKGAAIDASASESEIPTSADLRAAQSFAPSPHMPMVYLQTLLNDCTSSSLSDGLILAKTWAFLQTLLKINEP
jgi:hypothetical protein